MVFILVARTTTSVICQRVSRHCHLAIRTITIRQRVFDCNYLSCRIGFNVLNCVFTNPASWLLYIIKQIVVVVLQAIGDAPIIFFDGGFFFFFFLSVAFPARPYIRLPQPVPISKGRRRGCYLKYDPFENSSHVGRQPPKCAPN